VGFQLSERFEQKSRFRSLGQHRHPGIMTSYKLLADRKTVGGPFDFIRLATVLHLFSIDICDLVNCDTGCLKMTCVSMATGC
jgi:hypothetical protein